MKLAIITGADGGMGYEETKAVAEKGYHVSFGMAFHEKGQGDLDMHELVKTAENNMFSAKRDFYRQPEHNRRNR